MIMLRAFSYFLNPTIRFWPDPFVFRDLMHEFAPVLDDFMWFFIERSQIFRPLVQKLQSNLWQLGFENSKSQTDLIFTIQ